MAAPPARGAALLYANNNFLANKSGYGLEAQDIAIIVVLRHLSTPFAFTDAIWARYGEALSDIIEFKNPVTKSAPATNLYNSSAAGMSLTNRGVTLSSLVEKNVQFAVCGSAQCARWTLGGCGLRDCRRRHRDHGIKIDIRRYAGSKQLFTFVTNYTNFDECARIFVFNSSEYVQFVTQKCCWLNSCIHMSIDLR